MGRRFRYRVDASRAIRRRELLAPITGWLTLKKRPSRVATKILAMGSYTRARNVESKPSPAGSQVNSVTTARLRLSTILTPGVLCLLEVTVVETAADATSERIDTRLGGSLLSARRLRRKTVLMLHVFPCSLIRHARLRTHPKSQGTPLGSPI